MTDPSRTARLFHDLSNPLGVILAETQLLLEAARLPPDVVSSLRDVESAAIRMREILRLGAAEREGTLEGPPP